MVEPLSARAQPQINGYFKIRPLGKGTYGEAFLVEHAESRIRHAMKIVSEDYNPQQEMTEVEFLSKTKHPFIIKYIESFSIFESFRDWLCIVLEYADGCDLRSKMKAMNYNIPEKLALNLFTHACLGLLEMHSRGIIHRDIKPDNILIVGEVSGGIAKLGDFGTVKCIDYQANHTSRKGTIMYFAPERRTKNYSFESDVWSLGVVLYEMLSGGKHPFRYEKFEEGECYLIELSKLDMDQLPENISKSSKDLVNKLLEKDPKQRLSIQQVIKEPLIQHRIMLIVDDLVNGAEIAEKIKEQLLSLNLPCGEGEADQKKDGAGLEEQKTCSHYNPSTAASSLKTQDQVSIHENIQQLSLQNIKLSMTQSQESLSSSNLFTQQKLDDLISTFNKPLSKKKGFLSSLFSFSKDYTPQLNSLGQSKMTECILQFGWKWSLSQLNEKASTTRTIKWTSFEGANRTNGYCTLQEGVYYGQTLGGKRDGWGIVYCTDTGNRQFLYECEWKQGTPANGRYIFIVDNKWYKYEGTLDHYYALTGTGSMHREDGHQYYGEFKQGHYHGQGHYKWPSGNSYDGEFQNDNMHGQGKFNWPNGDSYDGAWENDNKHGQGRLTYANGEYEDGQFENDKLIGVSKYYSKEGKLIYHRTWEDGKLVKTESV
ncbi:hypothetical protein FGO68_gene13352 [Halteria grandinella]|uniref:non-specific serine/threonine protein kinase n=1 Tax=Halteria grandinella TaxID=5974 RepID=A0A8J8T4S8_HALGN|nr:hypothetical protein FGO68_gene13352 [Halteria grandinella]